MGVKFKCCFRGLVIYFIADVIHSASLVDTNSPKGLKGTSHSLITGLVIGVDPSVIVIITRTNLAAKHRITTIPAPALVISGLLTLIGSVLHLAFARSGGGSRRCRCNGCVAVTSGRSSPRGLVGLPKLPQLGFLGRGKKLVLFRGIFPILDMSLLVDLALGN